jgi:hypothetical protein
MLVRVTKIKNEPWPDLVKCLRGHRHFRSTMRELGVRLFAIYDLKPTNLHTGRQCVADKGYDPSQGVQCARVKHDAVLYEGELSVEDVVIATDYPL